MSSTLNLDEFFKSVTIYKCSIVKNIQQELGIGTTGATTGCNYSCLKRHPLTNQLSALFNLSPVGLKIPSRPPVFKSMDSHCQPLSSFICRTRACLHLWRILSGSWNLCLMLPHDLYLARQMKVLWSAGQSVVLNRRGEIHKPPPLLCKSGPLSLQSGWCWRTTFHPTTFWRKMRCSGITGASYSPSSFLVPQLTFVATGLSQDTPGFDLSALGIELWVSFLILGPDYSV